MLRRCNNVRFLRVIHAVGCIMLIFVSSILGGCVEQGDGGRSVIVSDSVLNVGDVVFRTGSGLESHAVLIADPNGEYSHVGIVVDTAGKRMIVHAVPGEPDFKGDPDRVKIDTPEKFFSSIYATAGEVCRQPDSTIAQRAAQIALQTYRRGVLFDNDYNLDDTSKMYCTELVLYVYSRAGYPIVNVNIHEYNLPLMPEKVVLPSDLYNTGVFQSIFKFNSKNN